jgi:hypothetical protein
LPNRYSEIILAACALGLDRYAQPHFRMGNPVATVQPEQIEQAILLIRGHPLSRHRFPAQLAGSVATV